MPSRRLWTSCALRLARCRDQSLFEFSDQGVAFVIIDRKHFLQAIGARSVVLDPYCIYERRVLPCRVRVPFRRTDSRNDFSGTSFSFKAGRHSGRGFRHPALGFVAVSVSKCSGGNFAAPQSIGNLLSGFFADNATACTFPAVRMVRKDACSDVTATVMRNQIAFNLKRRVFQQTGRKNFDQYGDTIFPCMFDDAGTQGLRSEIRRREVLYRSFSAPLPDVEGRGRILQP